MNSKDRFKFYENLYFREIERIEKISARLSLPFAALLAVSTILAFMLNAKVKPTIDPWQQLFWSCFAMSAVALATGAFFLRLAWFGHFDKLIPTADAIENYHSLLYETYAEYGNSNKLVEDGFNQFLFDYYVRFASENAINNDLRSYNIYRALVSFTAAILLALAAAIPFYLGSTDKKEMVDVKQNTTAPTTSAASTKRPGQYSKAGNATKTSDPTQSTVEPKEVAPN